MKLRALQWIRSHSPHFLPPLGSGRTPIRTLEARLRLRAGHFLTVAGQAPVHLECVVGSACVTQQGDARDLMLVEEDAMWVGAACLATVQALSDAEIRLAGPRGLRTLRLSANASLRLEHAMDLRIRCEYGALWLTHDGDQKDLILYRKERHAVQRASPLTISSLGISELSIAPQ